MTILESATLCKGLFREYLGLLSHFDRDRLPLVIDSSDRFGSWAYSTGAICNNRDSMDWRLVVGSIPHGSITSLLTRLAEVIKSEIHDLTPSKPRQNSSITESGADEQASIDDVLERLFKRWRLLSRSGALLHRADNASEYFECDEKRRVNLTGKFRDRVRYYLDTTLTVTNKAIKRRLENTIFMRHQHLCSLKARLGKELQRRPSGAAEPNPYHLTAEALAKGENGPSVGARRELQSNQGPNAMKRVPTQTALSVRTVATAHTAGSGRSHLKKRRMDKPMFPTAELPPRPSSCTEMGCPYCFEVHRPEELTRENWPRHIMQDLMPFVCVYETCPTPNAMFDSYDQWMQHIERYHMGGGWKCHGHHFAISFENKDDFRQHLIDDHGARPIDDSEFARYYPPCQPLRSCPFCTQYDDEHISEDLHEHIAHHLLFFSQVSLPGDFVDLKDVECGSEFDAVSSGNLVESGWLPSICSDTAQTDPFQSSDTEDEELSADIREPPPVKHEDGEPDIWMQLGFTGDARHLRQAGSTKSKYNPEMDGVLVPFRLRYISETQNYQKAGLNGAHGKEFVRSSVQLARSLDTKGQFSTAGAIMKKIMTDCTAQGNAPVSEEYARSTIESMLQGCPSFKYREIRRMLEYDSTDSDTTDSEHTDYTRTEDGSTDGNSNNCSPRHAKRKDTHDTVYSQV